VPGLLEHLGTAFGRLVDGPELFAYIAAVAAHGGYIERFSKDLSTPGLRIPLTADGDIFDEAVALGRNVIWLHTFGERMVDPGAGRPAGSPRARDLERPRVTETIPDAETEMADVIGFDPATRTLRVGAGRIAPVSEEMWEYETSGYKLLRRWFSRRKRHPEGRTSSDLDEIVGRSWQPQWTTELLDLLNVLVLLVGLDPSQRNIFDQITEGPLLTVADLTGAEILPVGERPQVERPERQSQQLL